MPKKKKTEKKAVHKDLEGFEIKINEFGEIVTNVQVDRINQFLNENIDDKKLREQEEDDPEKKGD